jgi:hypothetical protein
MPGRAVFIGSPYLLSHTSPIALRSVFADSSANRTRFDSFEFPECLAATRVPDALRSAGCQHLGVRRFARMSSRQVERRIAALGGHPNPAIKRHRKTSH